MTENLTANLITTSILLLITLTVAFFFIKLAFQSVKKTLTKKDGSITQATTPPRKESPAAKAIGAICIAIALLYVIFLVLWQFTVVVDCFKDSSGELCNFNFFK